MSLLALTLLFNHKLQEALLVVSFGDDIDKQVVLLPQAIDLIVLVFDDSALSVPCHTLINVLFLSDVVLIRVGESRPQIV